MASSFVLTRIIVCAVACAIAITSRPTTGQSSYMTALTGNLCRDSSERFEYDVTTDSTYRHRFHRRREPVAFVISTSPFVLLLLIIRGGDVSKNPGPADVRRQYTHRHSCTHCGKGVTARSRALSCDNNYCDQWTHLLCARSMTPTLCHELCNSGENFDFLCNSCSIGNLPFADVDDILSLTPTSDVSLSLSASISEEEDIFHDLRLVRNRCREQLPRHV